MKPGNWFKKTSRYLKYRLGKLSPELKEKIEVLNSVELFEFCRGIDLVEIATECEFKNCEAGETVIEAGDTGDGLYMVDTGKHEVFIDDSEDMLAEFGAGDYFGEMSLIDNKDRSANVICKEGGRLLFFSKEGFVGLLRKQSQASFRFLFVQARTLSQRLRETNRKLSEKTG